MVGIFLKFFINLFKGANSSSQLEKELNSDHALANEHYFGLVNVRFLICMFYIC